MLQLVNEWRDAIVSIYKQNLAFIMSKDKVEEQEKDTQANAATEQQEATVNNEEQQDENPTAEHTEDEDGNVVEMSPEEDAASKLQQELGEAKDKYLRLYSEFENFRRRTSREKLELTKTASEGLMTALLPILDDFERAQKSIEGNEDKDESLREGFNLIRDKFQKTLEKKGLKLMDHEKGSAFDADLHEAITQIPVEDEALKGKIVDVVEKGYYLDEKVIRYAKVVIGA